MEKLYYSRLEVPQLLGLSLSSVDQLLSSGQLKPRYIGSRVFVSREELDRFMSRDRARIFPPKQDGKTVRKLAPHGAAARLVAIAESSRVLAPEGQG
jgi:hypothetical protein